MALLFDDGAWWKHNKNANIKEQECCAILLYDGITEHCYTQKDNAPNIPTTNMHHIEGKSPYYNIYENLNTMHQYKVCEVLAHVQTGLQLKCFYCRRSLTSSRLI